MQALPAVGALVAGRYRIEALLGQGGMGAVYRARHVLMGTEVALKWLHPNLLEQEGSQARFLREARAAASVRHPHVVVVHDVGEHEGAPFLVMELLSGTTLENLLRSGPQPVVTVLRLVLQAMRGAEAAHASGLIHRDIKPENIFVTTPVGSEPESAKLLDFGTSKWVDSEHRLTRSGAAVGTLEFMSYEQMHGVRDIDGRTDVYAFGVVLYYALSGVSPFSGESIAEVALKVVTHVPPPLASLRPDLPAQLSNLVMKAIARRREQRYPSMSALAQALAPLLDDPSLAGALTIAPSASGRDEESELRTRRLSLALPTSQTSPEQAALPLHAAPGSVQVVQASRSDRARQPRVRGPVIALTALSLIGALLGLSLRRGERPQTRPDVTQARPASSDLRERERSSPPVRPSALPTSVVPSARARNESASTPVDTSAARDGGASRSQRARRARVAKLDTAAAPAQRHSEPKQTHGSEQAPAAVHPAVPTVPTRGSEIDARKVRREVAEGQRSGVMRRDDF